MTKAIDDAVTRMLREPPVPLDDLVARILSENPFSLGAAAKIFAEFWAGRRPHPGTIGRWVHRGHKLRDGTVVKLEAIACGGLWLTSRARIEAFIRAQQPATAAETVPMRSRSARSLAAKKAMAEGAELGAL